MSESEFINDFYQGDDYRKFRLLQKIYRENKALKEKNEFLMKRDNKCQLLEQVIDKLKKVIYKMIKQGYIVENGETATQYMATGSKSEFGMRAEVLLDILKGVDND